MKGFLMYIGLVFVLIMLRLSLNDNQVANDKTVLNLWTFQAAHEQYYKSMEKQWNKDHPDSKVELQVSVFPSEDMHNKLLVCSSASVGCPDIADIEVKRFPLFTSGDESPLVDLTTYAEDYTGEFVISRFDLYRKDEKLLGMPTHVGAEVVYYNQEIMDAAGVDSGAIVTWKDFIDAGYQVKAKTGKAMTVIETAENLIIWPILIQYSADYFDQENKLDLNNQNALNIYNTIQKLIKDGVVVVAPGGKVHSEDFYGYMNNGNVAALPMPVWYMNRFTDYMPDLAGKISIEKYPINPNRQDINTIGIGGTGTAVFESSEHKKLAAEYIAFAKLSDESEILAWEQLGFDPINSSLWSELKLSNKFEQYFVNNPVDVLESYNPEKISSPKMGENVTEIAKELNTNLYYELFEEKKEVESQVTETQEQFKK